MLTKSFLQLLTDPENQPHQFVGKPVSLEKDFKRDKGQRVLVLKRALELAYAGFDPERDLDAFEENINYLIELQGEAQPDYNYAPENDERGFIRLTAAEVQSGNNRQKWAEGLIEQLPLDHDGANSWLLNYGTGERAKSLRIARAINWLEYTQSAETHGSITPTTATK